MNDEISDDCEIDDCEMMNGEVTDTYMRDTG